MKNRIRSIFYDPASFPLPPTCWSYEGRETAQSIVLRVIDYDGDPESQTAVFTDIQNGIVLNMPEDDYTMAVKSGRDEDRFQLAFSFIGSDGSGQKEVLFDARQYLLSFLEATKQAGVTEHSFSVAYLEQVFKDVIDGDAGFWDRFYEDLDVVTAPMNIQILREHDKLPYKPVIVEKEIILAPGSVRRLDPS